jgi:hypothetical protein
MTTVVTRLSINLLKSARAHDLRPPLVRIRLADGAAGGGDAVGWDVEVDIDLLLKREDTDAER